LRTAALRGGSGVLALPFPFSDFEGVCVVRCADGLCEGGRMRSDVQAVPLRGGILIVKAQALKTACIYLDAEIIGHHCGVNSHHGIKTGGARASNQ